MSDRAKRGQRSRRAASSRRATFGAMLIVVAVQGAAAGSAIATEPNKDGAKGWSGLYFGGSIGQLWGSSGWSSNGPAGDASEGTFGYARDFDAFKGTGSYALSLQGGYNWRSPDGLVLGVTADAQAPSLLSREASFASANVGDADIAEKVKLVATLRARVGVIHNNWLWYGTGGYALAWDSFARTQNSGTPAGGTATADTREHKDFVRNGWVAGGGVEMPVAASWTANFEYLYTGFSSASTYFPQGNQRFASDLNLQSVRFGLNYQFAGSDVAKGDFTLKPPSGLDWSVHGQMTYVQQYVLPFRSPYVGTNSLIPNQTRQTWDATFYVGFRPWKDAEVWINPEIDQGFGVSGTLGLAGFASGEAYKLGSAEPYARLHRTFVRQTFNLSGESEKIEAGPNQLAGTQRENRIVVTLGKFGVPDIFDANKYAHDPRVDFLNWSLIDTGTFDYAADAWGYTYGIAAEYYTKWWTWRFGIFDLPKVPNSTELDPTFQQFQLIGEVERRYEISGNPGKLAITGFSTQARMGRFSDAIALANATAQPADIGAVRRYQSRTGISMNLEQQITPTIGFFARAGWADGSKEPFAFTDIDKTLAAGLVFNGKSWGRPNDTIGVAGVVNGISKVHQEFFNAGGLGILIGDGQLPRPSGERILETYYSFPVGSWRTTLDYQFIQNPAYNTDRGPVSIIGTRLRTAF